MTIYIFGNQLLKQDSSPVNLLPDLTCEFPDITFKHVDPTENWWEGEKEVTIIDTVNGIEEVTIFNSLDDFTMKTKRLSPHDYDVYMDLKLMMKIGKIKKVTIIGVPAKPITMNDVAPLIKQLI
jgi:hypothetical protein